MAQPKCAALWRSLQVSLAFGPIASVSFACTELFVKSVQGAGKDPTAGNLRSHFLSGRAACPRLAWSAWPRALHARTRFASM